MNNEVKIPKRRRRAVSLDKKKARSGYLFVAPFIIGIILIYIPILLDSVWFSLTAQGTWDTELEKFDYTWNNLAYYKEALVERQEFVTSLWAGVQQLIFEVPAIIIFALFIAVVLNQKMLGRAAFRAIFFIPVIISTGLMDSINAEDLMNSTENVGGDSGEGEGGGANQIISVLDVEKLFGNMKVGGELVTYVVNLVNDIYNIINYSGVQMLIFLAGLQSISPAIYEASRIDGATGWETFWKITFPMISPMILVNAIYTIIDAFTRSTNITMSYISDTIYGPNPQLATAMSWIYLVVVILIIAVVAGIASSFIFYQRKD
jgi:ABC-type sugar transport system permease subunit